MRNDSVATEAKETTFDVESFVNLRTTTPPDEEATIVDHGPKANGPTYVQALEARCGRLEELLDEASLQHAEHLGLLKKAADALQEADARIRQLEREASFLSAPPAVFADEAGEGESGFGLIDFPEGVAPLSGSPFRKWRTS